MHWRVVGQAVVRKTLVWKLRYEGIEGRVIPTQGRRLRWGECGHLGQLNIKSEMLSRRALTIYLGNLPRSSILGIKYYYACHSWIPAVIKHRVYRSFHSKTRKRACKVPFSFRRDSVKYLIQTVTIKVSPIRFRLISDVDKNFYLRVMHSVALWLKLMSVC